MTKTSDILQSAINNLESFPQVSIQIKLRENNNYYLDNISSNILGNNKKFIAVRVNMIFVNKKIFPSNENNLIVDLLWSKNAFSLYKMYTLCEIK